MTRTTKYVPTAKKMAKSASNRQSQKKGAPKAQPVPKKAPQKIAQRQHGARFEAFLDPQFPHPTPSIASDGSALPHTSLATEDFQVKDHTTILLATNTGNTATVGMLLSIDAAGEYVAHSAKMLHIPTVSQSDLNGGPSAGRAMKLSVSVVNCSNALKRGGRVSYINSSQRLPAIGNVPADNSTMGTNYLSISNSIKQSPYRRRLTGDNLGTPTKLVAHPTDHISYSEFRPWKGVESVEDFMKSLVVSTSHVGTSLTSSYFNVDEGRRPMSVIAFVFDPVAEQQDYSVTIRASYYTRWPLLTVPGQAMTPIPTAHAKVVNAAVDQAVDSAHDLKEMAAGGMGAVIAQKGLPFLRQAVGRMFPAARAAAPALTAAAEFAAPALPVAEELLPVMLGL